MRWVSLLRSSLVRGPGGRGNRGQPPKVSHWGGEVRVQPRVSLLRRLIGERVRVQSPIVPR